MRHFCKARIWAVARIATLGLLCVLPGLALAGSDRGMDGWGSTPTGPPGKADKGACRVDVTFTSRPHDDITPRLTWVEQVDMLHTLRPYVRVRDCAVGKGASIRFELAQPDDALVDVGRARISPTKDPSRRGRRVASTMSAWDMLKKHQRERFDSFLEADDDTLELFVLDLVWTWCESSAGLSPLDSCDSSNLQSAQDSFRLEVTRHHDSIALSLVTQPGRFLFTTEPCDYVVASGGGAISRGCVSGNANRQAWSALLGGSAFGVKVYVAPFPRVPWIGWSATLSTASLALANSLGSSPAAGGDIEGTRSLFFSPADFSISLIDFRIPAPVRIDIGPMVGGGLVVDGPGLRFAPIAGISISTPLVDVFGKRYGKRKPSMRDRRSQGRLETELEDLLRELNQSRGELTTPLRLLGNPIDAAGRLAEGREGLEGIDEPLAVCREFRTAQDLVDQATEISSMSDYPLNGSIEFEIFLAWFEKRAAPTFSSACSAPEVPQEAIEEEESSSDAESQPADKPQSVEPAIQRSPE